MKKILLIIIILAACVTKSPSPLKTGNTRSFQFTYTVVIESTDGEKLELWIPVPQSNKVQTISNLKFNTRGLHHSIENEKSHGNTYLYINDEKGITKATNISMTFEVIRSEHQNMMYNNVDPREYLGAYSTVPIGGVFEKIIADNNLSKTDIRGIYDLDIFMTGKSQSNLVVTEINVHKENGTERYLWKNQQGIWVKTNK